jgi:hypothetical protein
MAYLLANPKCIADTIRFFVATGRFENQIGTK